MNSSVIVDEAVIKRVLGFLDYGLVSGLGNQAPGEMCVEACWCAALGLPHGDDPPCVGAAVRAYKIRLNDSRWSSPTARANGLRRLAVAQAGSDKIDQKAFAQEVVLQGVKQILSGLLRKQGQETVARACEEIEDFSQVRLVLNEAKKATYAAAAAATYDAAAADETLSLAAEIGVQALIKLNCEGVKWLYLCDEA